MLYLSLSSSECLNLLAKLTWPFRACGCVGEQVTKYEYRQGTIDGATEVMVNLLKPGEEQIVSVMQQAPDDVSGEAPCLLRYTLIPTTFGPSSCLYPVNR